MCYSANTSLFVFSVYVLTSALLFVYPAKSNTPKILASFFMFVAVIQLFDYIFWTHQDMRDKNTANVNYIFTKTAMIWNHMQPIVLAILILLYKARLTYASQLIILYYTLFAIVYSIIAYNKITYTLAIDHENNKILYWEWNYIYIICWVFYSLFLLTLVILCYENFEYPINIIACMICVLSFSLSGYYWKNTIWGRYWCKIVGFIPIIFLLAFHILST